MVTVELRLPCQWTADGTQGSDKIQPRQSPHLNGGCRSDRGEQQHHRRSAASLTVGLRV